MVMQTIAGIIMITTEEATMMITIPAAENKTRAQRAARAIRAARAARAGEAANLRSGATQAIVPVAITRTAQQSVAIHGHRSLLTVTEIVIFLKASIMKCVDTDGLKISVG
jgi:hypothetical protein